VYLSETIDSLIDINKDKLIRRQWYSDLLCTLKNIFKNLKDTNFVIEKFDDFDQYMYSFSGFYDMHEDKKFIVLNLSRKHKKFEMNNKMFKDFKFLLSQVIQHESIHQTQWSFRPEFKDPVTVDFRDNGMGMSKKEERIYLSDMDEIDAYGHDIALEIKHYYPRTDPLKILRYPLRYNKLTSFFIYNRAFKGVDWRDIKKRLIRKAYKWNNSNG
jgi:hypothetical protein